MKTFIKDFNHSTSNEIINIIDKELALSQSNAMWHGRALSLLIPIVNSLIWMRDFDFSSTYKEEDSSFIMLSLTVS